MTPREKKPEIVHRIISKESGEAVGSYSRAYCDEYDFNSVYEARRANCHGMFMEEDKYKVAKYKVTYELIEDDCDVDEKDLEYYTKERDKFYPVLTEEQKETKKMFYDMFFGDLDKE